MLRDHLKSTDAFERGMVHCTVSHNVVWSEYRKDSWRSLGRSQLLYLLELIISWKLYFCYQVLLSNPGLLSEGSEEVIFPEKLSFLWPFNSIPKWRFNVFWMENRICVPSILSQEKTKAALSFSPWMHFRRAAGLWQKGSLHKASHFQEGWWGYFFLSLFGRRNNPNSVFWEVL